MAAAHGRCNGIRQVAPVCCAPHLIRALFGPTQVQIPNDISISSIDQFVHSSLQSVPVLYSGRPLFSSKLPLCMEGSGFSHNIWLLEPTWLHYLNGISISSAFFAGLSTVDRPADHTTRSVRIGRIYVRTTVMRPNNNLICTAHNVEDISSQRCRWRADVKVWMSQCR